MGWAQEAKRRWVATRVARLTGMRILVTVPWTERLGGAEAMLQTVLDGVGEREHEFEFVFFDSGPWPSELRSAGFRVDVISTGRLRQIHRWMTSVFLLMRIIRRRKPDLILNWAGKAQLYGAPAAVLAGVADRVVWWHHAIPARIWIDRCATALPAIAVGCYTKAAAEAQAQLRPFRPTFVVAPGTRVPRPQPQPAPLQLPADVPIVGIVGRLQPWKGQDRLLRAQAILHERGHRCHTVIVGGDAYNLSPEYARSLAPLIRDLQLDGAVTMTGQVPDAAPYVDQMDILVNASDPEPFGIVLLEAMARSVAVVAVNSGGPAEFIEDGRTGMLASSGAPEALADALEPLLLSPDLRQTIGQAGHDVFERDFTDVAMRRRFFGHLDALIGDRHVHRAGEHD